MQGLSHWTPGKSPVDVIFKPFLVEVKLYEHLQTATQKWDARFSLVGFGEAMIVVLRPQDMLYCIHRSLGFTKDGGRSVTEPIQSYLGMSV